MLPTNIEVYLNDHLAGSCAGLELVTSLKKARPGAALERLCSKLIKEFEEERSVLRATMKQLSVSESLVRKTGAWVQAKLLRLKLTVEDRGQNTFYFFEGLEALSVGIGGKQMLWETLATLSEPLKLATAADFVALGLQAERQRSEIAPFRIEAASNSLARSSNFNPARLLKRLSGVFSKRGQSI